MTQEQAIKRVLEIADAEVGYREKASNKDLDGNTNNGSNNWTKYSRDLDAVGYYNGRKNGPSGDWCDIFVDWCVWKAFSPLGYSLRTCQQILYQPEKSLGAGTGYSAQYFKANNAFVNVPQVGDQIFFRTTAGVICHTGIVETVGDSWIQTIEGNSANMVARHVYNTRDRYIAGYGIPKWSLVSDTVPTPVKPSKPTNPKTGVITVETRELSKGSTGQAVKSMQLLLIGNGFSCGSYGADGDFGDATKGALMAYQKKMKLTQDGICGQKTWNKLING